MASPAALPDPPVVPPPPEPQAIRACLTPTPIGEFDREWDLVLDEAKLAKNPTGVADLLAKWRHIAYREMTDPGSYYRTLAQAEQILRTRQNPGSRPWGQLKAELNL